MYYRNENGQNKVSLDYTMTHSTKDLRPHKELSFWQGGKLIYVDQYRRSAYPGKLDERGSPFIKTTETAEALVLA